MRNSSEQHVACVKEYMARTFEFRSRDDGLQRSCLLLSLDARHCNIKTQTVSSWIKQAMELSGIDTATFKAHSIRGATVSSAFAKGLSLKDLL